MKNKKICPIMYKKIGQKILIRKVCVYLPSRQIFKFGKLKREKVINKIQKFGFSLIRKVSLKTALLFLY